MYVFINFFFKITFLYLCARVYVGIGYVTDMAVRGRLARVSFLFLPWGSQGRNSGPQAWQPVPLPDELFYWPSFIFHKKKIPPVSPL